MKNRRSLGTLTAIALGLMVTPALAGPDWALIEQARAAKRAAMQTQSVQSPCVARGVAFPYGPRPQAVSSTPCKTAPMPAVAVDTPRN